MFVKIKSNPNAKIRLFCFPYAGGGASIYRKWGGLADFIEVIAVALPGRETKLFDKPFDQLSELVESLVKEFSGYLDKPYVFFGHSMGALICYELSRHLYHQYKSCPVHMIASGFSSPQIPRTKGEIYNLPLDQFIEELIHYNGTPQEILQNKEMLNLIIPSLRADFKLCETYVYSESSPINCAITVYGGDKDDIPLENLIAWNIQTAKEFRCKIFPGDHFFINSCKELLLEDLNIVLKEVLMQLTR